MDSKETEDKVPFKIRAKKFFSDLWALIKYTHAEPIVQFIDSIKDVSRAMTNKKVWIYFWTAGFIVFSFLRMTNWMILCLAMFYLFYLVYHYQVGEFRHVEREKIKQKAREMYNATIAKRQETQRKEILRPNNKDEARRDDKPVLRTTNILGRLERFWDSQRSRFADRTKFTVDRAKNKRLLKIRKARRFYE